MLKKYYMIMILLSIILLSTGCNSDTTKLDNEVVEEKSDEQIYDEGAYGAILTEIEKIEIGDTRSEVLEKISGMPIEEEDYDLWDYETYTVEVQYDYDIVTSIDAVNNIEVKSDFTKFDEMTPNDLNKYVEENHSYDDITSIIGRNCTSISKKEDEIIYSWNDREKTLDYILNTKTNKSSINYSIGYAKASLENSGSFSIELKDCFDLLKSCSAKQYVSLIENRDSVLGLETKFDKKASCSGDSGLTLGSWDFGDCGLIVMITDSGLYSVTIVTKAEQSLNFENSRLFDMTYDNLYDLYYVPTYNFNQIKGLVGSECTTVMVDYNSLNSGEISKITCLWESNESIMIKACFNKSGLCTYIGTEYVD